MVADEPAIVQRRGSCRGAGGGGWDEWSGRARVFGHLSVVPTCIVAGYNPTVPRECTSFMIQEKRNTFRKRQRRLEEKNSQTQRQTTSRDSSQNAKNTKEPGKTNVSGGLGLTNVD
jgi:hypothetical protein